MNRAVEVVWGEMPSEYRKAFEPVLKANMHIIPGWCRHISIRFETTVSADLTPEAVASCECDPEYRQAKIRLYPLLLAQKDANRARTGIHELLHIPLSPLTNWMNDIFERFIENEAFRAQMQEEMRARMEGVVQDLTFAIKPPE